jgi:hypothetical protein
LESASAKPNVSAPGAPRPCDGPEAQACVALGVVVAPGLAREVTAEIVADLSEDLRRSYGEVGWRTELIVDRLVVPPVPTTELFEAARRKLLEGDWDLSIVVTDLPLRVGRRPLSRHISRTHGIAVVSLPALGAVRLRQRLRRTLLALVGELVGDDAEQSSGDGRLARIRERWDADVLRELATETAHQRRGFRFLFVPAVLLGNLRLLLGMVRANRPWRLAARLYRALVAALAAGAYGLVNSDIWRISAAMGWGRLAVMCVASIVITIVAIIAVHGLWERAPEPRVREQVVLFNVATVATVAVGILSLYGALFALILAGAGLVLSPGVLERALDHPIGTADYAALAWFVASLATVGGGLGAGLESDEAVREAAYAAAARRRDVSEDDR